MNIELRHLPASVLLAGILTVGAWSCSSNSNPGDGTGGKPGSGGTASGGTSAAPVGGAMVTGGAPGTGGSSATPGVGGSGQGGKPGTGGSSAGAGGVQGTGGSSSQGGTSGADAAAGGDRSDGGPIRRDGSIPMGTGGVPAGTGGTSGGGTTGGAGSSGSCQKGQVKAKEVVIMGESFYAMPPMYIEKRIEQNAQKAGAIASGESYRNVAVSGQPMNYVATAEWDAAKGSTTKFVIMDGGGIDCMSSSCSSCPGDFKTLLGKMATAGVQDVLYTRYPEPGNPPGSNATLKGNLDTLMPKMEEVCKASTSPKCHWVDLRPVWVNGDTSDGLHPTQSGGDHVGDLIWSQMVKDCLAQ